MSLKDNDFGCRDCPFYKNSREVSMNDIITECKAYVAVHGPGSGKGGEGS